MKKGEISCEVMACTQCPFNEKHLLRVCTSFKKQETLNAGLAEAKKRLTPEQYGALANKLDMEEE